MIINVKRLTKLIANQMLRKVKTTEIGAKSERFETMKQSMLDWVLQNDPTMYKFFKRVPAEKIVVATQDYISQHGYRVVENIVKQAQSPENIKRMLVEMNEKRLREKILGCLAASRTSAECYKIIAIDNFRKQSNENVEMLARSGGLSASQIADKQREIEFSVGKLQQVPAAKFEESIKYHASTCDLADLLNRRVGSKQKGFIGRIRDKIYNFFEVQIQCFFRGFDFIKFILLPAAVVTLSVVLWNVYKTVRDYYSRLNQPNPLLLPRCLKPCLNLNQNSLAFDSIAVACLPYFVRFNHKQRLLKYCYTTLN